jgi:hypothetical protein
MAFLIRNLRLDKAELLSVVDKGASGDEEHRPRILLMKRRKVSAEENTNMAKTAEEILAALPEEDRAVLQDAMAALAAKPLEEGKAEGGAQPVEEAKQDDASASPEDDEQMVKLAKRADDLAKRVAQLEDEKTEVEFLKRAKELPHIPAVDSSELGSILKSANENLSVDHFAKLESIFKSVNEALSKSGLLAAVGVGGGSEPASPHEKLDMLAKRLKDEDPSLSMSRARMVVSDQNPELFQQIMHDNLHAKGA